jgi:hypothetical protein
MRQPENPYKNSPHAVPPVVSRGHEHLIPVANRLLAMTARGVWKGTKLLVKAALVLPRVFVRMNQRSAQNERKDARR